ncbi:hypothetical protein FWJ25_13820 [Marinobacter salinexigens]|uniref:Trimeric autotransporter adhesin YadA-like stalk domain-containing protein n=1 Tax=Marinobacter salinexigens TaxID=2919747 RepID=A0A5B0VE58_9GAMM|nr:hypothetical protein [Marinobacter salinexigens]KAA1172882.1 hypothetical protein FWJ25_13820 [Marinobacter salinexigens]
MRTLYGLASTIIFSLPVIASAEVILDDLIVQGSACVGADCVENMTFEFDTLVLRSATPQVVFQDTSNAGTFPSDDWVVGATDGGLATQTSFFIKNLTNALDALVISADGDVALGAGAAVVEDAVSVGDLGSERRVTHVADAVDDTDAVTLAQFNVFKGEATASVAAEVDALDTRVSELEARLSTLVDRLEAVAAQVD